jgi:protein tyrosine phosphatase (PTP) superfamily phosphohydrolase (DUF442 family)
MTSLSDQIQDFLAIRPDLLTAGQPMPDQFDDIRSAGCQVIINLAAPQSPDYIPEEKEIVESLGMEYVPIPVEWEAPKPADLQVFFSTLDRLKGQKLFIHCARNMRVSAFIFLYRVVRLDEPVQACLSDLNLIWQPTPLWQAFIDAQLNPDNI